MYYHMRGMKRGKKTNEQKINLLNCWIAELHKIVFFQMSSADQYYALMYITKTHTLSYCSVYGQVIRDFHQIKIIF